VCGGGLSTSQAKTLREYSTSDKVLVVLSGNEAQRNQNAAYLHDLAFFFDRVRAVSLPPGETLAGLANKQFGAERLNDLLVNSRPLLTYRTTGRGFLALQSADPGPPHRRPEL
jgi:hypothetical protein